MLQLSTTDLRVHHRTLKELKEVAERYAFMQPKLISFLLTSFLSQAAAAAAVKSQTCVLDTRRFRRDTTLAKILQRIHGSALRVT